jgi:hypothetical protein
MQAVCEQLWAVLLAGIAVFCTEAQLWGQASGEAAWLKRFPYVVRIPPGTGDARTQNVLDDCEVRGQRSDSRTVGTSVNFCRQFAGGGNQVQEICT